MDANDKRIGNGSGRGGGGGNGDRTTVAPSASALRPRAGWHTRAVLVAAALTIAAGAGLAGFLIGERSPPSTEPSVATGPSTTVGTTDARDCRTPNNGVAPVVGRVSTKTDDVVTIGGGGGRPTVRVIVLGNTKVCRMQPGTLDDVAAGEAVVVQGPRRGRGVVEARQITVVPRGVSSGTGE